MDDHQKKQAVWARVPGAMLRAVFVFALIATPTWLIPFTSPDAALMVAFVGVFAAVFTLVEYSANAPSLVEFRASPPFNRLRFASLFLIVASLSFIAHQAKDASTLFLLLHALGVKVGLALDFPFSPVRLMVLMMPDGTSVSVLSKIRTMTGLAYLISLLSLLAFVLILRFRGWPTKSGVFNVWVNLPTFDPSAGGDVIDRLNKDSQFNLMIGFLMPFIIPAIGQTVNDYVEPISLDDPQTMIWVITTWAFLPLCLLMRGVALARVAQMIYVQRKRAFARSSASPLSQTA